MSISFPIDLPTFPAPRSVTLTIVTNIGRARSPWTLSTQKQKHKGQMWIAEVNLPPMQRADAEAWQAFITSLNGPEGTFWLGDKLGSTPRGVAVGAPVVNGNDQVGGTLLTRGWGASVTGILKAGDYIQVGTRLHKLKQDADSDSSGNASLEIWPDLHSPSPADGLAVITEDAKGLFELADNSTELVSQDEQLLCSMSFVATEAL